MRPSPAPDCPVCGGAGVVGFDVPIGDPRFGTSAPCPAPDCPARMQADRERAARLFEGSGLEGEQAGFRLDDPYYEAERFDRAQDALRRLLRKRALRGREHTYYGLWMEGPNGVGKSGLAAASVTAANDTGIPARFQETKRLLDWLRAGFDAAEDGQNFEARLNALRRVPWLVMDDLGAHNATVWAVDQLADVLNARYVNRAAGLVTIITSNKTLDEIAEEFNSVSEGAGWRIRSRVRGMCYRLPIAGPDGRAPKGE